MNSLHLSCSSLQVLEGHNQFTLKFLISRLNNPNFQFFLRADVQYKQQIPALWSSKEAEEHEVPMFGG